ncbi:MAG: hypothetical protein LBH40_00740 [Alphaproteobacteria bacterium]|jgi:hypothetical protein|nr:hypothetical protein [Alphaproteobacteria bacterium]
MEEINKEIKEEVKIVKPNPNDLRVDRPRTENDTTFTYIENQGIGYKTSISEIAKFLLKDYMGEVLSYPAGDSVVEEINVDGVIIVVANGREIALGTYPLYEEYKNITTATYNLPNYLEKPNIISNFPDSGKLPGDTIDWQVPSHSHFFNNPFNFDVIYSKQEDSFRAERPYTDNEPTLNRFPHENTIEAVDIKNITFNNIESYREEEEQDFQPELIPLTPYIVVDYRG